MSFAPLSGPVATASKAFRHFTNRLPEQAAFRRRVEAPAGAVLPVLSFYGVGGAGKSWLLQKLAESVAASATPIPVARITFEPTAGTASYATDFARGLSALRQQMSAVFCPRFDLAYAWLRQKEGGGDEPALKHAGYAATAWDLTHEVANAAFSWVPGINLVTWCTKKIAGPAWNRLKETPLVAWLNKKTGEDDFLELRRLPADEIYQQLSHRLLQDLNENLPKVPDRQCRGVLLFDGYERLVGDQQVSGRRAQQDLWIRELYHPESPVLLVIAGRDKLSWGEFVPEFQKPEYLDQHLVGGLSTPDAERFLALCGVDESPLRQAILRVCRDVETTSQTGEQGYHAYSLGVCADAVANARQQGRTIDPATFDFEPGDHHTLASRFLTSLNDGATERWIRRLALTPQFDESAAREAWSPHRDTAQDAAWDRLDDFSFVLRGDVEGWWTLHPRMRRALSETHPRRDEDHAFWQSHWSSRQTSDVDDFAGRSWFHEWQLEPEKARLRWDILAERERQQLRMVSHLRLLGWWQPTPLGSIAASSPPLSRIAANGANSLGVEWQNATQGNRTSNLQRAIDCYEVALRVYTEADFPQDWAMTQNNLGNAYQSLPTGDRGGNLQRTIDCYEAALRVYTEADFPQDWATIQNNLGAACQSLPTGDRGRNLQRTIDCYEAALRVRTEADFPQDWAMTQNNLGNAYQSLPTGDRGRNLQRAIDCYEAALRVRTEADFPQDWAMTQNNLGAAYRNLPTGDLGRNLQQAIDCYEAALRVYTEADFPQDWAMTQNNLGLVYWNLPTGDRGRNLQRAIDCYEAALRIRTEADFPQAWAMTQNNLGLVYWNLPTGDRGRNLQRAIGCYEAALRVYTEVDFPQAWAMTKNNLGIAYQHLPTGDRGWNLQRAIDCYEAALRVSTEIDFPQNWAMTQNNLGNAYQSLPTGDRGRNLQRAIECYEAALRVCTEADFPQNWATTQNNLGTAYWDLSTGDRGRNLQRAIDCYEGALRVYTEADFPQNWARTMENLALVRAGLAETRHSNNEMSKALADCEAAIRGFRHCNDEHGIAKAERTLESLRQRASKETP